MEVRLAYKYNIAGTSDTSDINSKHGSTRVTKEKVKGR